MKQYSFVKFKTAEAPKRLDNLLLVQQTQADAEGYAWYVLV